MVPALAAACFVVGWLTLALRVVHCVDVLVALDIELRSLRPELDLPMLAMPTAPAPAPETCPPVIIPQQFVAMRPGVVALPQYPIIGARAGMFDPGRA